MVSPIRIKTPEVRIQMRLKVANCFVTEDKSFLVRAVARVLSHTGRINSDKWRRWKQMLCSRGQAAG